MSIHSKYKFTQLTQFERTSREAPRSYLLPVHGSTAVQLHRRRIVHQSSDQVCVPRHNIVVLSHHFDPPPPPSRFFLFQSRVRESFGIYYGKPVQFSLSSLFLASSPFHLRQTTSSFFFSSPYLNFSVIARSYPSPCTLILFSLHSYASAIITGEPTAQIFNLVWQMADLEARAVPLADGTKEEVPSVYVRSCESRKFSAG